MFLSTAWAQATGAAAGAQPNMIEQFFPFVIILGVFYFLIIRPAQRRQKQQASFLTTMKRGDSVLTTGGILGTIEGLTDQFVTLEVAQGVRIRVLKTQVSSGVPEEVVKK
jgi:preprotein translocase subunit YajC